MQLLLPQITVHKKKREGKINHVFCTLWLFIYAHKGKFRRKFGDNFILWRSIFISFESWLVRAQSSKSDCYSIGTVSSGEKIDLKPKKKISTQSVIFIIVKKLFYIVIALSLAYHSAPPRTQDILGKKEDFRNKISNKSVKRLLIEKFKFLISLARILFCFTIFVTFTPASAWMSDG